MALINYIANIATRGVSGGALAGIILGSVFGVGLLDFILSILLQRKVDIRGKLRVWRIFVMIVIK